MQSILNMAKELMPLTKGTSPSAGAISYIPFMAATSQHGLASDMYQKPDVPKQITLQDSALLSVLQKIKKIEKYGQ